MFIYLLIGALFLAATLFVGRKNGQTWRDLGDDRVERVMIMLAVVLAWPPLLGAVVNDKLRGR